MSTQKYDVIPMVTVEAGARLLHNGIWLHVTSNLKSESLAGCQHVKFRETDIGTHIKSASLVCVEVEQ